ncbi:glycoside hydrolase family 13 domain protein [Melioribacter roseus P3M-2]|uniref:Glycoside hydrolase family 13 domain protein n=1 Tax=Melioribacter roseus (strain DSM 23840 / JCM 17771 / VKM B-2668 / P3M-2) TaxID=1191523 RepID=I6ZQE8_MELRP|nr:isoamylase early set domain-containing protein [Melioribacter roseus]AFN74299.1 glycoside hydrolase family 13 domain protein [Melioribacter roseus P3M-2]
MSIKKEYSKDKAVCRVTFTLPEEIGKQFKTVALMGDFNNWDPKANHFTTGKDGSLIVSVELEPGNEYQFRYLCDGETWLNDPEADKFVQSPYGSENCVIAV